MDFITKHFTADGDFNYFNQFDISVLPKLRPNGLLTQEKHGQRRNQGEGGGRPTGPANTHDDIMSESVVGSSRNHDHGYATAVFISFLLYEYY